jgi:hypothetical protein
MGRVAAVKGLRHFALTGVLAISLLTTGFSYDEQLSSGLGAGAPVSAAIEKHCAEQPHDGWDECKEGHQWLARFASETRDPVWAPAMEAKLTAIAALDSSLYTVRHLACRATICILEVESLAGRWSPGRPLHPPISGELEVRETMRGNDRTIAGPIRLALAILMRIPRAKCKYLQEWARTQCEQASATE